MPLFEPLDSPRARFRVFLRAQLPFAIGTLVVAVGLEIVDPRSMVHPTLLAAWAIVVVATLATVALPWERFAQRLLACVALADIVAVALIRAEAGENMPAVTLLAVFPLLWLAYGFGTFGIVCAIAGTGVITSLTFIVQWRWPTTAEWVDITVLPILVSGIAVVVHLAARALARSATRARTANLHLEQARAEAVDQALLLRSILDTIHAGVGYYDCSNRLILTNDRAEEMFDALEIDVDVNPHRGEHVLRADRVTPVPDDERVIARALRGDDVTNVVEWIGRPGAQMAVAASSRRVRRDDGATIGTVIVAHDVTELALAVELREEFLKTVSHELRTPVTNIAGYSELIADRIGDEHPHLRSDLDAVQRNVDRLTARLRELLAATDTPESLHLVETDVCEILSRAVAESRTRADAMGVTIDLLDRPPGSTSALAEPDHLREAVSEVIRNAVKHGPPSAAVTVGLVTAEDRLLISVTDTGRGIAPSELSRVFDRFYRTEKARRDAVQGFGLGLTMVKNVARAHGGRVRIDADGGTGTRVTIDLPAIVR